MAWKTAAIIAVIACLPVAAMSQPAKPATAKAKPKPHPVEDVGAADLFHGYRCGGGDCLLHQQGYQWGADHKISNPSECRGTSEEFIEGCRAFAGIDGPLGVREIFQDED